MSLYMVSLVGRGSCGDPWLTNISEYYDSSFFRIWSSLIGTKKKVWWTLTLLFFRSSTILVWNLSNRRALGFQKRSCEELGLSNLFENCSSENVLFVKITRKNTPEKKVQNVPCVILTPKIHLKNIAKQATFPPRLWIVRHSVMSSFVMNRNEERHFQPTLMG